MQLIKKRFALSWNDNIVILLLMAKKKKKRNFRFIFFYILALPVAHVIVIYTVQNI